MWACIDRSASPRLAVAARAKHRGVDRRGPLDTLCSSESGMHTLLALFAVVAACVFARPPAPVPSPSSPAPTPERSQPEMAPVVAPGQNTLDEYFIPHFLTAAEPMYDDRDPGIDNVYRGFLGRFADSINGNPNLGINLQRPGQRTSQRLYLDSYHEHTEKVDPGPNDSEPAQTTLHKPALVETARDPVISVSGINNIFAFTPYDSGFYDKDLQYESEYDYDQEDPDSIIDPRQTRQNPNLSRNKALVASNLDQLRIGLANKEYRMPVSLLPANINWLKIYRPNEEEKSTESASSEGTAKPRLIHVYDTGPMHAEDARSIYGIALIAAVGAAVAMAITGFAIGWYSLAKRAKAAADVDYPAYGVTGPTAELAGDRKLAHSAHMYHYQHQKQQILAMERNCVDQSGSVSDVESEEENEEGDYTVYECPGFATTGEMEVKNPLFTDENAPATPGKCELVKPQPKE